MLPRRDLRRHLGGRDLQVGPTASAALGSAAPDVRGEIHGDRWLRRRQLDAMGPWGHGAVGPWGHGDGKMMIFRSGGFLNGKMGDNL